MKDVNLLKNNGIDVDKSLELFGDMETYDETLEEFLNSVGQKLSDIKKFKETSDMSNYAILVHSLKSDSKYLGFTTLAELSFDHETKSKENDVDYIYNNYDKLMLEADRIVNIVEKYLGENLDIQIIEEKKNIVKDKSILVVDDSTIIRNFILKIFDDTFEVIMANDGKEAIEMIEGDFNNSISGMLLDLNMPNINGFEVLSYFKHRGLFNKIPVSIITGDDSRDSIDRAFTYPIVDVLTKPFNERDVKRVVEKTLNFNKS